jgi:hypothetical protein
MAIRDKSWLHNLILQAEQNHHPVHVTAYAIGGGRLSKISGHIEIGPLVIPQKFQKYVLYGDFGGEVVFTNSQIISSDYGDEDDQLDLNIQLQPKS